ncbi:MAG: hypothetical protein V4714_11690 [Bacteroidota bacterium]
MKTKFFNLDNINTSECYYRKMIIQGNSLFIPVINIGLMEDHSINNNTTQLFIDRAYLLFKDIKSIRFNSASRELIGYSPESNRILFYISGYDLEAKVSNEIEIECLYGKIIIFENSKMSDKMWIPIQTPNFSINMNPEDVQSFTDNNLIDITE